MTAPSERDIEAFSSAIVEASLQVSDGMRPVSEEDAANIARWMLWGGDDNPPLLGGWMAERNRWVKVEGLRDFQSQLLKSEWPGTRSGDPIIAIVGVIVDGLQDAITELKASNDQIHERK